MIDFESIHQKNIWQQKISLRKEVLWKKKLKVLKKSITFVQMSHIYVVHVASKRRYKVRVYDKQLKLK